MALAIDTQVAHAAKIDSTIRILDAVRTGRCRNVYRYQCLQIVSRITQGEGKPDRTCEPSRLSPSKKDDAQFPKETLINGFRGREHRDEVDAGEGEEGAVELRRRNLNPQAPGTAAPGAECFNQCFPKELCVVRGI